MTENKRFIQKDEAIIDTMTDELVTASSEEGVEIIVDWINKLLVKNAELSQENYELQDGLDFYKEQNAYLSEQINELEQGNQDERIQELLSCNHGLAQKQIRMFDKLIQLEKENKQLKEQLEEETDRIIELEQYIYTKLCPKSENYNEEVISAIINTILGDVE